MATNYMTGPVAACIVLIQQSSTFQGWVGAADATEALDSIAAHEMPVPPAETARRPFAMVTNEGGSQSLDVGGAVGGTLAVTFEDYIDSTAITQGSGDIDDGRRIKNPEALLAAFQAKIQLVAEEMMSNANQAGRLMVRRIEKEEPSVHTPPQEWNGDTATVDNGENADRTVIPGAYISTKIVVHYGFEGT